VELPGPTISGDAATVTIEYRPTEDDEARATACAIANSDQGADFDAAARSAIMRIATQRRFTAGNHGIDGVPVMRSYLDQAPDTHRP